MTNGSCQRKYGPLYEKFWEDLNDGMSARWMTEELGGYLRLL
jgi:hypothetical protein